MKTSPQTPAPPDAKARKAVQPVICYPVDTLPQPGMALHGTHLSTGERMWSSFPYLRPMATITCDSLDW